VISHDNVSVKVNAVIYFRVVDPERAIIQVNNCLVATSQLVQTTLRWVLGKHDLDEMLAERGQTQCRHSRGARQANRSLGQ
jgi:regulator of protease activity HflC (stomatin/prohibitin superfamily)